jgi:hypothetical protein
MGDNRSGNRKQAKVTADPQPAIKSPLEKEVERLLDEGYAMSLIAQDTGVDIKKVRAIKAAKLLPTLLAEHEDSEEDCDDTKLDATQAGPGQTTPSQARPTLQEDNPADWRGLTEEDLEEEVLDRSGVIELILSWLKEAGQSADDRDSIGSALNEAQIDASKAIREQGLMPPIRLRRESALMLHRIALWSLGKRGRGRSSQYRVIKENQAKRMSQL